MKAVNTGKLASLSVLTAYLIALSVGTAAAQSPRSEVARAQHAGPKVVAKTHPPVGTPHKASSFAPHHTNRRVFGDPIQPPILHNAPKKKPDPK